MTTNQASTGATGFLFGNIDRRGRLDEDYLSDEAKDTIDNVGAKVTEKDANLREISQSLPPTSTLHSDDEDYDDPQLPSASDDRVDYYDETEEVEDDGLDDQQRAEMAQLALRTASAAPDEDDEDYDDDPPQPDPPAPTPPVVLDPALQAQRKLLEDARERARVSADSFPSLTHHPPPLPHPAVQPDADEEDDPIKFSRVFSKPSQPIQFVPKRRRFGIQLVSEPSPILASDDVERLETAPPAPVVDPIRVVLAYDAPNSAVRYPRPQKANLIPSMPAPLTDKDAEEYEDAAKPLDPSKSPSAPTIENVRAAKVDDLSHALVQQVAWEDDIIWNADTDADEEDDWYISVDKNAAKDTDMKDGDNSDDDDDEFEEPVIINELNPKSSKQAESDSDEDMEWEDGQQAADAAATEKAKSNEQEETRMKTSAANQKLQTPSTTNGSNPVIKIPLSAPVKGLKSALPPSKKKPSNKATDPADAAKKSAPNNNTSEEKPEIPIPKAHPGSDIIKTIIAPNKELEEGTWIHDVVWDSQSESDIREPLNCHSAPHDDHLSNRFSRLILDMNDPNMIFEHLSDDSVVKIDEKKRVEPFDATLTTWKMNTLIRSSGTQVLQLLEADRFNISNDLYYASGTSNFMKVDRRSILRGLQNAPPAVKCQTTKSVLSDEELLWFRRPKLKKDNLSRNMEIVPFRRKRPKGGNAQIAGQIPKKRGELLCAPPSSSARDAYRVSLYEYTLERQPCILPIPGMASRIVTYARKSSAAAAAEALKNAAGTPEADTVFMSPDEPPPVHAGDLEADGPPLSVVESHVYSAPCVRTAAPTTDFLLIRRDGKLHVREIDSIVSLGVTEPKVEIMAPNTDRFKKYSKDRVLLWILREFARQQKDKVKQIKQEKKHNVKDDMTPPSIEKEQIFDEFNRRRTYSETSLLRLLKELARYQNGRYIMSEEPSKGFAAREAELLRTVTPQETAAFEAMESGWEILLDRGIQIFTYPSSQGNITAAAERSGLEAGPAVGAFIKNQLLKSPWHKSQMIISAQKQQRKELLQVLSLARIVNDLREGGTVMESRLMSLTAAEMNNVLTNQYRVNSRKIPTDVEERRVLVREMAQKKGKSNANDVSDYAMLIQQVMTKHRNAGLMKAGANPAGTATAASCPIGLPLEIQRRCLEHGDVEDLPIEEEDGFTDADAAAAFTASGEEAFGKKPVPKEKESKGAAPKKVVKKAKVVKKPQKPSTPMTPQEAENAEEAAELEKLLSSSVANPKPPVPPKVPNSEPKRKKKKVTRLKVTKKVTDPDGTQRSVVKVVTDPDEIARLLEKEAQKSGKKPQKKTLGPKESGDGASSGGLKIAIDLRMLSQGGKAGVKKKQGAVQVRKKVKKPSPKEGNSSGTGSQPVRKSEKGQIGKIKISTKQLHKDKQQAALKRKRSQYGDDLEYRAKKTAKTSRRKRNGTVELNSILEKIEKTVRETDGYVASVDPVLKIARLRDGESPPPGVQASNLAAPKNTGLDFTSAVDTKLVPHYKDIVKRPMYLNLIKYKCKRTTYQSASEYLEDMDLLVRNARAFNSSPDVQWVVQHAELLQEVAVEQVSRKADEIRAAEEMVALEKSEAKNASASGANAKSKSKKTKSKDGKKGQNSASKKDMKLEVVEVQDGSDKEGSNPNLSVPVIDLSEEPLGEHHELQSRDGSPPPAPSPILDAGMTDDIYSIEGPVLTSRDVDGEDTGADNVVLDLDDIGGNDVE